MALATCFRMVVLPALGGDTINPRCPRPMGVTRLIKRVAKVWRSVSKSKRVSGKIGVSDSKLGRFFASSGSMPFIFSTLSNP